MNSVPLVPGGGLPRVLCLDVDGVLSDGRLWVDEDGRPLRAFQIQDGFAIRWYQKRGGTAVILTGKSSAGVAHRARELDVRHVIQGSDDKHRDLSALLRELGATWQDVAAIGDDLPDLPLLRACRWPIVVANATVEVRGVAKYITRKAGGHGAVREAIEWLMRATGEWDAVVQHYARQGG